MTDFANLVVAVSSTGAERVTAQLDRLAAASGRAQTGTARMGAAIRRLRAPALAAFTAMAAAAGAMVPALIRVTKEYQNLDAQLITSTGSSEDAAEAFDALQEFATQTPYDLKQATHAFNQLVNLGLTPSEEALRSYGDTASAMGRDLSQMVEAVADATVGEFERLKEFGIKAKSEGDNVSLTFRGMTETIGKNSAEIEQYLINLGQVNFGGSMERQTDTLDGAISNLGDTWDRFVYAISESGIGDAIESTIRKATAALESMAVWIETGRIPKALNDIGVYFQLVGLNAATAAKAIVAAFAGIGRQMIAPFIAFDKVATAILIQAGEKAKVYAKAVKEYFKPSSLFSLDGFDLSAELAAVEAQYGDAASGLGDKVDSELKAAGERSAARMSEILAGHAERYREIRQLEEKSAAAGTGGDRLAKYKVGSVGDEPDTGEDSSNDEGARALAALQDRLASEEEAIASSHERRVQIIADNTKAGSELQRELYEKSLAMRDEESAQLAARRGSDLETLKESFLSQAELLASEYEKRRQIILDAEQITGEERQELMAELDANYAEQQKMAALAQQRVMLDASAQGLNAMAQLTKQFAGEQSTAYRVMFAASKAFAIADAGVKIAQGIAAAASLVWPLNLAAMASTVAATASIIPMISGQNYSGAYDKGGDIPAGSWGVVGEKGAEIVHGPATVISRVETQKMMEDPDYAGMFDAGGRVPDGQYGIAGERGIELVGPAGRPAAESNTQQQTPMNNQGNISALPPVVNNNVRVVNNLDPSVVGDYLSSDDGEELILNTIKSNPEVVSGVVG